MHPHQAAYWLDKDPAEAAEFLAKTAVASRRVGGFVKAAYPYQAHIQPVLDAARQHWDTNPALRNATYGAGAGALAGGAMGIFGKRRKNPLTTALTGGLIGAGLGAGLPAAMRAWNQLDATTPDIARAEAGRDIETLANTQKAPLPSRVYAKLTGNYDAMAPKVKAPTTTAGQPHPQGPQDDTWGDIAGTAVDRYAPSNAAITAGIGAGGAAAGASIDRAIKADRVNDFHLGVTGLDGKNTSRPLLTTLDRGMYGASDNAMPGMGVRAADRLLRSAEGRGGFWNPLSPRSPIVPDISSTMAAGRRLRPAGYASWASPRRMLGHAAKGSLAGAVTGALTDRYVAPYLPSILGGRQP